VFCGNDEKHINCVSTIHILVMLQYVAQLIVALCFKPEGRGFDFPRGDWDLSVT